MPWTLPDSMDEEEMFVDTKLAEEREVLMGNRAIGEVEAVEIYTLSFRYQQVSRRINLLISKRERALLYVNHQGIQGAEGIHDNDDEVIARDT